MLCLVPKRLTSGAFYFEKSDNDLCSFPWEAPIEAYRKTPTISQMERGFYFEEWLLQKLQLVKLFVHHIISDLQNLLCKRLTSVGLLFCTAYYCTTQPCSLFQSFFYLKGRDQFAAFALSGPFSQIAPAALCSLNSQCSIGSLRWAFFLFRSNVRRKSVNRT